MMYILDGRYMTTREAAHAHIRRTLSLPEYYGGNLDALWDLICDMTADIRLICAGAMLNALGVYGCKLLSTLYEAMDENPNLTFSVQDGSEDLA